MNGRAFRSAGFTAILLCCLGILHTRAAGVDSNADSLKAVRLLTLSEKARDQHHSVAYALQSLSIGFQINNHLIVAQSYRQLAACYRNVRAPQLYELDSLAIANAILSGNHVLYFDVVRLVSIDFLNSNQTKKAAAHLTTLDSLAQQSNSSYEKAVAFQLKSFFHHKKFQPAQSLAFARKSLAYAREDSNHLIELRLLQQIGQELHFLMKRDSAAIYLFRALDIATDLGNSFELANVQNSIGFLYQMSGNQERSRQYYQEAVDGFLKAGFPIEAAYSRLALSDVYSRLQRYDSARATIRQALRDFQKYENQSGQAMAYNYLGRFYNAQQQPDSSRYFFNKARVANQRNSDPFIDFFIKGYEAANYLQMGDFERGNDLIKKELAKVGKLLPRELIEEAIQMVSLPDLTDSAKLDLKRLFLSGDTAAFPIVDSNHARDVINPYTGTESRLDSLVTLRQHEAVARVEAQFRVKETRDSLQLARRDQQIARQKVTLRNQILVFTGLLLIALLFLIYLQRRHNKTVRLLKEEADHRISNTLNNVSSIIESVKAESGDQTSFEVLEERIAPLMLLYELLNSSSQGDVDMQPYFEIICEGRQLSYDPEQRIGIDVDAAVTLSGKTAGRVGLIVNELVTNAFKHAFTDQTSGKITVRCHLIEGNRYYLSVADNGKGLIPVEGSGRGLQQVKELAWEIDASMNQRTERGTLFEFYFSNA